MERRSSRTLWWSWLVGRGPEEAGPRRGATGGGSARRGGTPVREGGIGWVGELQEDEELPFHGLACAEEGQGGKFGIGLISPASMCGGGTPKRVWWLWALENVLERSSVR